MVEGQETKEVEPRLPRLPNGWLSCQSRQHLLYVILAQDNKRGDPNLLPIGEIRSRHRSNQLDLRYVRCEVIGDLRSMEGVTKGARALDKGFRQMRVDPK